ncbi:MAG: hypothetical protein AABZ44_07135, partial [Elusimicrobiota bacterium]
SLLPMPFTSATGMVKETSDAMVMRADSIPDINNVPQGKKDFALFRLAASMDTNGGQLTGLVLRRQGSTPDSSISNVKVWKDADADGNFSVVGDTVVSLGINSFFNGAVNVALSAQSLSATTKYFFITVDIDANAVVASTFSVVISTSGDVSMSGGSDYVRSTYFPVNSDGSLQTTSVQQYSNLVVIRFTDLALDKAAVGAKKVPIEGMRLYSDLNNVTWSQMRVDYQGTNSQDIERIYLHQDSNLSGEYEELSDLVVTSGAFAGSNTMIFSGFTKTVSPGNSLSGGVTYFITVDVATSAIPANNFTLRWTGENYFTVNAPNQVSSSTFLAESGSVVIKPPPVKVFTRGEDAVVGDVEQGQAEVPMLKLKFWTNLAYNTDISKIRINLTADAPDDAIDSIRIVKDDGDGSYGLGDSLLGQGTFNVGTSLVTLAPTLTANISTVTVFILYDINGDAAALGQMQVGAGLNSNSYIDVGSENSVDDSGFPIRSSSMTVKPTVSLLNVTGQDVAPPYIVQGSTGIVFEKLLLKTTDHSLSATSVVISKTGTLNDAEVTNIEVYNDVNKDGSFNSGDVILNASARQFVNGRATIFFDDALLVSDAGTQILVALAITRTAPTAATVGVQISSANSFTVSYPNLIYDSGFPFSSTVIALRDLPDKLNIALADIADTEIGQGKKNQGIVKVTVWANEDSLVADWLRFDKTGSLYDVSLTSFGFYKDDGDGLFGTTDTLLTTATLSGGFVLFDINETVTTSSVTYFISVSLSDSANVGDSFEVRMVNGYAAATGIDAVSAIAGFVSKSIKVRDVQTPTIPIIVDAGKYTASVAKFVGNWKAILDSGAIDDYRYCIGTTPGGTEVKDWTSVGVSTWSEIVGVSLSQGTTYYLSAKALSSFGKWSSVGISDGIIVDIIAPVFVAKPSAQVQDKNIVLNWTKPQTSISGIKRYYVEERRADAPTWTSAVLYSTSGAKSLLGQTLSYKVLAAGDDLVTATDLQVVMENKVAGTYFYRLKAVSGADVTSDPSEEIRVVVGIATKEEAIFNVQAYPNPVDIRKQSVNIYYDLNRDSDVEIKIFDLFGKDIKTLSFSAGAEGGRLGGNLVKWDGRRIDGQSVSFGVYLLRIKANVSGATKVYKVGVIH